MSRPLVLMYHGVGERAPAEDPDNLFVPAHTLIAQLEGLLRGGWTPLSLDAYLARHWSGRGFLLTFDDGYVSVGDIAAPILAELAVPALCFVCPGRLGGSSDWSAGRPEPLLDADGVRELPAAGIEVGAHGWDHTAMPGLSTAALQGHTDEPARALAAIIGHRPRSFAYPYGAHDPAARRAVAETGYSAGFATYNGAGPLAVPRVDVNALDTRRSFRMKTWPIYPTARGALARAPALRAGVHTLIGRAERGDGRG
jgi:peptidoglycan/xylan/chitin deacetylase (PgdA/CDA1 family)